METQEIWGTEMTSRHSSHDITLGGIYSLGLIYAQKKEVWNTIDNCHKSKWVREEFCSILVNFHLFSFFIYGVCYLLNS